MLNLHLCNHLVWAILMCHETLHDDTITVRMPMRMHVHATYTTTSGMG